MYRCGREVRPFGLDCPNTCSLDSGWSCLPLIAAERVYRTVGGTKLGIRTFAGRQAPLLEIRVVFPSDAGARYSVLDCS